MLQFDIITIFPEFFKAPSISASFGGDVKTASSETESTI
jgi:hypothetical protein